MRSIIAFLDTDLESVSIPQFVQGEKEELTKGLYSGIAKLFDEETAQKYRHQVLLYLGKYNEETGVIDACLPEQILTCDKALAKRAEIKVKEVSIDGEKVN